MTNIVITGANRGIGFEMARQYAEAGDTVYAFCRNPAAAEKLNAVAKSTNGRLSVHAMDVGDAGSIKSGARDLGDVTVDVLINNAGILGGTDQTLDGINFDEWANALKVMAIGPFQVVQAFLPALSKSKNPKIMTVTSQLAASTWPYGGNYGYSSAKAAVNKVMQTLAIDLKDRNITVNMIHPGWVKTDMGGDGADITPSESATGIRNVIGSVTLADTGKFYKWNGDIHAW